MKYSIPDVLQDSGDRMTSFLKSAKLTSHIFSNDDMRRVNVSSRRRSRSRSPVLRGPRTVVSSNKSAPVNMLDLATVEKARAGGRTESSVSGGFKSAERITCTIAGDARERTGVSDRLTGGSYGRGSFGDNRRSDGGRRSFGDRGGERSVQTVRDRLSFGDRRSGGADLDRRRPDMTDERRNGSFRDEDKPVQRLIDPTAVPKARSYFDHDDRGANGDAKWRGRTSYDPRIDFGPRRQGRGGGRDGGWSGFGGRSGGGRYDDNRRSFDRRERQDRPYRPPPSKADGVWTHDKYLEVEADETEEGGVEVHIDQRSPTKRRVEAEE